MPERIRGYRGGYLPLQAARDRAGPARRAGARRRLHQRARARHRHRRARRERAGRLSRARSPPTWQRAGRAGRRSGQSAAVLVASSAPLDQFIVRHPSYFFDASPEHALINPDNLHILVDHVKCAAFELPFTDGEAFGGVERAGGAGRAAGVGPRAPLGRRCRDGRGRPVALDERVVPGRRRQPAVGVVRQLRGRRPHRRLAGDRRDRLHERASRRSTRRPSTSSRAGSTRSSGSTSRAARRTCARSTATTTPTPSTTPR